MTFRLLLMLACVVPDYQREYYEHWVDMDGDCLNTRAELLIERSLLPVVFSENGCRVLEGAWLDAYTGKIYYQAGEVHIDHVVALKEAHDAGAWEFSREKKKQFANDPDNLLITHGKVNISKSAKGFDLWFPKDEDRQELYIQKRLFVMKKYGLRPSASEAQALVEKLN